jgi:hypothetical protein
MRYYNQSWYIASLYKDLIDTAFGPPGVNVTVTKKWTKWFLDNY